MTLWGVAVVLVLVAMEVGVFCSAARPKVTETLPADLPLLADEKFDFDLSLSSLR